MSAKCFYRSLLAFLLLMTGTGVHAISLSVVPGNQTVNPGDSVLVELVIADLAPGGAPSVSVFDLDLGFDESVLALDTTDGDGDGVIDSVLLDPSNQLDPFGLKLNILFADRVSNGVLNLLDVSLETPATLNNQQLGSFTLATITFLAFDSGSSPLNISINSLGDANGQPLQVGISNGSVLVSGSATVPVTSNLWLMVLGLLVLAGSVKPRFCIGSLSGIPPSGPGGSDRLEDWRGDPTGAAS